MILINKLSLYIGKERSAHYNSLFYRWISGTFWSICGSLGSSILGVVSSVLVARQLGKEGYGGLGIILSTINMFQVIATFGLGVTATKYVAEYRTTDPNKAGKIIALSYIISSTTGIILALLLFLFADWIATNALGASHLSSSLRLSAIMVIIFAINSSQVGALAGFEAFKDLALMNFIVGVTKAFVMVLGVILDGLEGCVIGLIIVYFINIILNQIFLNKASKTYNTKLNFRGAIKEFSIIYKFSIPALLAGLVGTPALWLGNAIITKQPNGLAEMGVFNAASQWRNAVIFIPTTIGSVLLPMLSNLTNDNSKTKYRKVLFSNVLIIGIVSIFFAFIISLFSKEIMNSYGSQFSGYSIVLIFSVWSTVFSAIASGLGYSILSQGKMWSGFALNLIWAVTFVILIFLYKNQGAEGLAKTYLISYAFHFVTVALFVMFSFLKQKQDFK